MSIDLEAIKADLAQLSEWDLQCDELLSVIPALVAEVERLRALLGRIVDEAAPIEAVWAAVEEAQAALVAEHQP